MKNLIVLLIVLSQFLLTTLIFSQENYFLVKRFEYSVPEKIEGPVSSRLQAGTYSVGNGGYFLTLDSAFNKLSIDGIDGNVTLELIDDFYTATSDTFGFLLDGPIPGSGPGNRITIKPAPNKNVTIEGSGEAVLNFRNVSYLTVEGVGLKGSTTLKIHSYQNSNCPWNDGISFLNNSKHNVVQNVIIECEDYTRSASGIVFIHQSGNFTPDSNLIQNNFVRKATIGICVTSFFYKATGNIIHGNIIGSEMDSLISFGINVTFGQNTLIENNQIQNIRNNSQQLVYSPGIVSLAGTGDIIRNNVIHNVYVDDGAYGGIGIILNGTTAYKGCINSVYNNMVYDIQSTSPNPNSKLCGIEIRNQHYPKVYFNSVYLSGSGANQKGSAAFYIDSVSSNVCAKNNIFINTRDESPYCASAIFGQSSNLTSDYNDLFCLTNQNNFLVRCNCTNYQTLLEWQSSGQDIHSYSEMPHFVGPDLHVNKNVVTYLSKSGIPIGGIDFDIDREERDPNHPDIGADEFDLVTEISSEVELQPNEIVLGQNYPNPFNPATTIRYSVPTLEFVTLKVYDVLGNEIASLVNEEKSAGTYDVEFNARGLSSGVYFYTINAGRFVETKKMLMIK
jgi:hypothetical protein